MAGSSPAPSHPDDSPEVPLVGGVLDVVTDVVEHAVGRGAVSGIEHLWKVRGGTAGYLPSPWQVQGRLPL